MSTETGKVASAATPPSPLPSSPPSDFHTVPLLPTPRTPDAHFHGRNCMQTPRGQDYHQNRQQDDGGSLEWMITRRRRTLETGILSPCCLRIKSPVLSLSSCAPSPSDRAFRSKYTPIPDSWMIELYVVC